MTFDRLAPVYDLMERWFAGRCLQQARTAFLDDIPEPEKVLTVGEGHGRFLEACRRRFPRARIVCVDGSGGMKRASGKRYVGDGRTEYVQAWIEEWETEERFDLVVTHFFFDCFPWEEVGEVVRKIASHAEEEAVWLVADFSIPERGPARWRARLVVGLLYGFFRRTAGIRGSRLVPPDGWLEEQRFTRKERVELEWGMLKSEWWERKPGKG